MKTKEHGSKVNKALEEGTEKGTAMGHHIIVLQKWKTYVGEIRQTVQDRMVAKGLLKLRSMATNAGRMEDGGTVCSIYDH